MTALERLIKRSSQGDESALERCDLCSVVVPPTHRHVFDVEAGQVQCACTACSLLFEKDGAGLGRYRLVPRRRVELDGDVPVDSLDVPVGLAFFVKSSREGRVVAHYPSPMGATRWDFDVAAWDALEARHPELQEISTDVEALLLNTARGASEMWVVPIDDCYRLVAVIRREWRGLSGGSAVWVEIEQFFAALKKEVHPWATSGSASPT